VHRPRAPGEGEVYCPPEGRGRIDVREREATLRHGAIECRLIEALAGQAEVVGLAEAVREDEGRGAL